MRTVLVAISLAALLSAQAPPDAAASPDLQQLRHDLEAAKRELAQATDALAVARAQHADCETTLGPFEAEIRRSDSDRRWSELKALMEKNRPGFECNPHTGDCSKKPATTSKPPGAPQ